MENHTDEAGFQRRDTMRGWNAMRMEIALAEIRIMFGIKTFVSESSVAVGASKSMMAISS